MVAQIARDPTNTPTSVATAVSMTAWVKGIGWSHLMDPGTFLIAHSETSTMGDLDHVTDHHRTKGLSGDDYRSRIPSHHEWILNGCRVRMTCILRVLEILRIPMTGILHIESDKSYNARNGTTAGHITRDKLVRHVVTEAVWVVGLSDATRGATRGTAEGHQVSRHLGLMHLLLAHAATDMDLRRALTAVPNLTTVREIHDRVKTVGLLPVRRMAMIDRPRFRLGREEALLGVEEEWPLARFRTPLHLLKIILHLNASLQPAQQADQAVVLHTKNSQELEGPLLLRPSTPLAFTLTV